jgi:sporulation protein YlmC with PRC-barrel domain
MRLSNLRDKRICTLDGKSLGRVHEVHCDGGRIVALMSGPGSFIERLTTKQHGGRIPWERVVKVEPSRITVAPDAPKRKSSTPGATRNRQGTRRASARRSKR